MWLIQSTTAVSLDTLVHPDDRDLDQDLKQRLLNGEIDSYTTEKRLITQTQGMIWVNFSVSRLELLTASTSQIPYLAIALENTTESHNLYDALVRTEEKWKTFVLNSAHLFLQLSDIGRILYISPAVERTLGYREEELLDRSIVDLIHIHDLNEFNASFQQWRQGNITAQSNLECRWQTKSGQWMYLYVQGQRFQLALEIEGIALSGYNISDRKYLETALRASEKKLKSLTQPSWNSVDEVWHSNAQ